MRKRERQSGFGTVEILLIVLIVSVVALGSFMLTHRHEMISVKNSAATSPSQTTTQPQSTTTTQPPAKTVYADWPVYSNQKYGFSYSYPTVWMPSAEVTIDPKSSATRQEFGTGLQLKTDTKNNNTVVFEVLDEPLKTAEALYDQSSAQTSTKVNKTTGNLKEKQSLKYDFVAPTYESRRYLFAVGSKTYVFSSVNESLNVSLSANYWSNFDNTLASLTIR